MMTNEKWTVIIFIEAKMESQSTWRNIFCLKLSRYFIMNLSDSTHFLYYLLWCLFKYIHLPFSILHFYGFTSLRNLLKI